MAAVSYNAAADLIGRNLPVRADKVAFVDEVGSHTFATVGRRAAQCGAYMRASGILPGDRVALCLLDGVDFAASFLGAILAGAVPVPLNTLFKAPDYAYILQDSGARAAIVSAALLPEFEAGMAASDWDGQITISAPGSTAAGTLQRALEHAPSLATAHAALPDDVAFWLYSSGSTGRPKGVLHRHLSPARTAERFAIGVLGLRETDIVYSAAKLFFAYGLGNALTFPMVVGATSVLWPGRASPDAVCDLLVRERVSVFFGVPTLFASLLAHPDFPGREKLSLRLCVSAGEALPQELGRAWTERTGVEIVDGIGSTEMLHIYVSNTPGAVKYGATGHPVPGYEVKLLDESGYEPLPGDVGELYVRGETMPLGYWNQPEKTAATFVDGWMKTGDKFIRDDRGRFVHCGRADDMLKVSGIWVSPAEVENALLAHPSVLEAAVIGVPNAEGLVKTKAFVVLKPGVGDRETLAQALQSFVKRRLAPYKYPREIAFVDELPKTATGKIRRHVLREQESAMLRQGPC